MTKTWSEGNESVYLRRNRPDDWNLEVGNVGTYGITRRRLEAVKRVIDKALAEERGLEDEERKSVDPLTSMLSDAIVPILKLDKAAEERRVPVQGWGNAHLPESHPARAKEAKPPGTITWEEHLEVWEAYAKRYGEGQSAERLAERGGFGYMEATSLLMKELRTWRPR